MKRVVHVFENTIFNGPFIDFVRADVSVPRTESYFTWGGFKLDQYPPTTEPAALYVGRDRFARARAFWRIARADRVVLHGLFNRRLLVLLFCCALPVRVTWVIWGGDLQAFATTPTSWRGKLTLALRRLLIRRVNDVAVLAASDHEKYVALTGRSAPILYGGYVNPITLDIVDRAARARTLNEVTTGGAGGITRVLIGNSATASNQHVVVFESLAHLAGPKVEFIVPLGYGDMAYREVVLEAGRRLLGSSFHPILEQMPIAAYVDVLAGVDVAILYMPRQQALSNVYGLLALGRKLFLHPKSGTIETLRSWLDVGAFDYDEWLSGPRTIETLRRADPDQLRADAIKSRRAFDRSVLVDAWTKILES